MKRGMPNQDSCVISLTVEQSGHDYQRSHPRMRDEKQPSQGDIEKRTGLLRCYISRVENGHTVPAVETLEKIARALEVPLYQLFCEGEGPPTVPGVFKENSYPKDSWGSSGKDARYLSKLRTHLGKTKEQDRKIILLMAQKMALR